MSLQSQREVDVTREKLRGLEEEYEAARTRPESSDRMRELTLRSLKKLINQLKEELVRSESRITPRTNRP